jgi:hypothetical protein
MEISTTKDLYREWRSAVDQHLHQVYCITIEDAGLSEDYLNKHWQSRETPSDFVKWYGNKYDLDSKLSLIPSQQLGR